MIFIKIFVFLKCVQITLHHKIDDGKFITRFYGITQDPETKNYIMVLEYAENGSLRNYLNTNYDKLSWKNKFNDLYRIACNSWERINSSRFTYW